MFGIKSTRKIQNTNALKYVFFKISTFVVHSIACKVHVAWFCNSQWIHPSRQILPKSFTIWLTIFGLHICYLILFPITLLTKWNCLRRNTYLHRLEMFFYPQICYSPIKNKVDLAIFLLLKLTNISHSKVKCLLVQTRPK